MRRVITILVLAFAASCGRERPTKTADPAVERLIGQLVQIDAQAPGLHSTALVRAFMAEDKPAQFAGGVLGSSAPKTFPQMQELVRRGVTVVPSLIQHLDDKRATKLTVGGDFSSGGFFTFAYFGDEYDPKTPSKAGRATNMGRSSDPKYGVPNLKYTVRVGDVCYALIGQIVNRGLLPVRYQPSMGLVVNSPIREPSLIKQVKRDWGNIDTNSHMASLIADAHSGDAWYSDPALQRLRFYYPDEYQRQKSGSLTTRIQEFENTEK